MKISILTPVYNSASYLAQCIESVLQQTHTDWQMVCVNDASTDNSLEILQHYASIDSRIEVIDQEENQGIAKTRMTALQHCAGRVIMTLDSDDWLAEDALKIIADTFDSDEQTDCVMVEALWYYSESDIRPYVSKSDKTIFTGPEAFRLCIDWGLNGIYAARRHIYDQYSQDDSYKYFSDDNTTRIHFLISRRVRTSHARYYYRQHYQSITHNTGIKQFIRLYALFNLKIEVVKYGANDNDLKKIDEYIWRNIMGAYMTYYACRKQFSAKERSQIKQILAECYNRSDTRHLPLSVRLRFGYAPLKWCPTLYHLQMLAFTNIRLILGMDRHRYNNKSLNDSQY